MSRGQTERLTTQRETAFDSNNQKYHWKKKKDRSNLTVDCQGVKSVDYWQIGDGNRKESFKCEDKIHYMGREAEEKRSWHRELFQGSWTKDPVIRAWHSPRGQERGPRGSSWKPDCQLWDWGPQDRWQVHRDYISTGFRDWCHKHRYSSLSLHAIHSYLHTRTHARSSRHCKLKSCHSKILTNRQNNR